MLINRSLTENVFLRKIGRKINKYLLFCHSKFIEVVQHNPQNHYKQCVSEVKHSPEFSE